MNKFLAITALTVSLTAFQPAFAQHHEGDADLSKTMPREKYKEMSDEERKKFHEQRKAKWESMSKEEKLSTIEKRRAEKKAKMEEKWNSMSDDEKIGFVEKKMKKRGERKHGDYSKKDAK